MRLPLADAAALRPLARRTLAIRVALAIALAALVAAAVASAAPRPPGPAQRSNTEVVIDVSGSIGGDKFGAIAQAMRALVADVGPDAPVGLVFFSEVAQEALPPGSPASELARFAHYFADAVPGAPPNPWQAGYFSGGTVVPAGLHAAREALRRDGLGGRVVIVSDLLDPLDKLSIRSELTGLLRDPDLDVRVVALPGAAPVDVAFYRKVLGRRAVTFAYRPVGAARLPRPERARFPAGLVVAAALAALALALNELFAVAFRARAVRA